MIVLVQKIASLQRCVARARQVHRQAGAAFRADLNAQDAAVLNVIRACDTAIDLANMLIRMRRLGVPNESRDAFRILTREGLIDDHLGSAVQKMVGFRSLAVHQYHELDLAIVEAVIAEKLDDLLRFAERVRLLVQGD